MRPFWPECRSRDPTTITTYWLPTTNFRNTHHEVIVGSWHRALENFFPRESTIWYAKQRLVLLTHIVVVQPAAATMGTPYYLLPKTWLSAQANGKWRRKWRWGGNLFSTGRNWSEENALRLMIITRSGGYLCFSRWIWRGLLYEWELATTVISHTPKRFRQQQ